MLVIYIRKTRGANRSNVRSTVMQSQRTQPQTSIPFSLLLLLLLFNTLIHTCTIQTHYCYTIYFKESTVLLTNTTNQPTVPLTYPWAASLPMMARLLLLYLDLQTYSSQAGPMVISLQPLMCPSPLRLNQTFCLKRVWWQVQQQGKQKRESTHAMIQSAPNWDGSVYH